MVFMVAYFRKTLPNNPVMVAGRALRFDLLQTENPEIINGLRLLARRGSGGVIEINSTEFESENLKKKNSRPSLILPQGREEFAPMLSPTRLSRKGAVESVGGAAPAQSLDGKQPLPPGHVEIVLPTIGRVTD
jgi:hypothetical protein